MSNRPDYKELLEALRSAPPPQAIPDDRYIAWRVRVEALLRRCD